MRLTTKTSIMGRKHDLCYGCASVWEKKLRKNYRYELIENAIDKLGQLEDLMEKYGIENLSMAEGAFIGFVGDYNESTRNHIEQMLDIEDELGIDLVTLILILKAKKLYIKGSFVNFDNGSVSNEIKEFQLDHDKVYIRYADNYFELITHWEGHRLDIKNYGKTWALMKEELL